MGTQTTLSAEEQAEVFHAESFKLASSMAADWTRTLGDHTPSALIAAIDAFGQMLVPLIGGEATADFLTELAGELRKRGKDTGAA